MNAGQVAAMALATVGRIVHYVMKDGAVRPMLVVNDFGSGMTVNGVVFIDVFNDEPAEAHDGSGVKVPLLPVSSVPYDSEHRPGTWHWPTIVQRAEVSAQLTAEHVEAMFATFRRNINEKLESHLEAVGKIADNLSSEFTDHVRKLGSDVAAEADKVLGRRDNTGIAEAAKGAAPQSQEQANAEANAAQDEAVALQQGVGKASSDA